MVGLSRWSRLHHDTLQLTASPSRHTVQRLSRFASSSSRSRHVTVLGAGLTGLYTAYRLSSSPDIRVTLLETASRVGGWVDSRNHPVKFKNAEGQLIEGEVTLESGPRSIRPKGSRGAAGMLRLVCQTVTESRTIGQWPSLTRRTDPRPWARARDDADPNDTSSSQEPIPPGYQDFSACQTSFITPLITLIKTSTCQRSSPIGCERTISIPTPSRTPR